MFQRMTVVQFLSAFELKEEKTKGDYMKLREGKIGIGL